MQNAAWAQELNRRYFLKQAGCGLGAAALGLLAGSGAVEAVPLGGVAGSGAPGVPHHTPKAKRVIYLFQSGAPSRIESFDYKPSLKTLHESELPDEIRMGQRLTGMTAKQKKFPVVQSIFDFKQHG